MAPRGVVGRLLIRLGYDPSELEKSFKKVRRSLNKTSRELKRSGAELSKGLTLPLAAAGAGAVISANKINKSMASVGTLLGKVSKESTARLQEMRSGVQDLAVETGKSTEDLSRGLFQTISAFGDTKDSLNTLDLAARASVAGLSTTEEALSLLSATTKAYGDTSLEAQKKVADLAFKTNELGETTFPELAGAMGQVAALAAELNLTQEELFAVFAAGTGPLGKTSEVATKLKGALSSLLKPTKDMEDILAKLGVSSGQALVAQLGFKGALDAVQKTANSLGIPLGKVVGSVEGLGLAFAFGKDVGDQYERKLKEIQSSAGALDAAFEQQTEGVNKFGFALERLQQSIATAFERLGNAILDAVGPELNALIDGFSSGVNNLVMAFRELTPETQRFLVVFGALSAAIGPLLIALGTLVGLLGGVFLTKIGLVAASIAFLGTKLVENRKEIFEWVRETTRNIKLWAQAFKENFSGTFDFLKRWWGGVKKLFETLLRFVKFIFDKIVNFVVKAFQTLIEQVKSLAGLLEKVFPGATAAIEKFERKLEDTRKRFKELKLEQVKFEEGNKSLQRTLNRLEEPRQKITALRKAFRDGKIDVNTFREEMAKARAGMEKIGDTAKAVGDAVGGDGPGTFSGGVKNASKAVDELRDKELELQKEAYTEGVEFWRKSFENAITGVTFSLSDSLNQVAVGFAAELAQAVFGSTAGIGSPQDLGGLLGQLITGGGSQGGGILGQLFGITGLGGGAADNLIQGPLTEVQSQIAGMLGLDSGQFLGISSGLSNAGLAAAAASAIQGVSLLGSSSEETAEGIGQIAGAATAFIPGIGPFIAPFASSLGGKLGGLVADAFGLGGPSHPGTLARIAFVDELNKLSTAITAVTGTIPNFDARLFDDFNKFDAETDFFGKFGQDTANIFDAFGKALGGIIGDENLDGGQIGVILAEGLGGQLEGLKAIADSFNVTLEQMNQSLVDLGKQGELTWHEVEVGLQNVNKAFKPGIEGVGNFTKALDNLLQTGARGQIALNQLKNIAVEAQEAGISSLEELKQQLIASGEFSSDVIAALFIALQQRGVGSLEQLANAGDRLLGGIVADLVSLGVEFGDALSPVKQAAEDLDELNAIKLDPKTQEINFVATGNVELAKQVLNEPIGNRLGNLFKNGRIQEFAKGGIFNNATLFPMSNGLGLLGEAGPEMLAPVARMSDGSMGIKMEGGSGGTTVVNIDARGAEIGVERRIERKVREIMSEQSRFPGRML